MYEPEKLTTQAADTTYITRAELEQRARLFGNDYVFKGAAPAPDEAVLAGRFNTLTLRPGLILHAAEVCDLHDMGTQHMLNATGIKIGLLIGGATEVAFGHRRFRLGPQSLNPADRNKGALVSMTEPELFTREWSRGRTERKVSLTLTTEWLEEGGLEGHACPAELKRFARTHLDYRSWMLTPRVLKLAQQILGPNAYLPGLHRLRLESQCIELAVEALGAIHLELEMPRVLSARDQRCIARLEDLLQEDSITGMTMTEIAHAVGSNPTSLQALAKQTWNTTIFERLRTIRMNKAYELLSRGASVTEAAGTAGYASATNFSTAFKQRFGATPRCIKGTPTLILGSSLS